MINRNHVRLPDGGLIHIGASLRTLFCAGAALLAVGCQTSAAPELSASRSNEVRREIEQRISDWSRWTSAGHIDSIANAFTLDAWEADPNLPPVVGREAILDHWRRLMQMGEWSFEPHVQEIIVSDSIAVERSTYTLRFVPVSGGAAANPAS